MARNYKHSYKYYAELYDVSLPSIKRYAAAGRPLDDPDTMGEWLSTRGRKPDKEGADESDQCDREAEARLFSPGPEFYEGAGLSAEIRRLTTLTREAAKRLGDAMAGGNARERQNRLNEYLSLVEAQRKLEKENPGILRETEKAILISEVEEGVTKLLLNIVERCNTIPIRCMQTLPGLTAGEIREELEREFSQAMEPIRACVWVPEEYRKELGIIAVPESGTVEKKPKRKARRKKK